MMLLMLLMLLAPATAAAPVTGPKSSLDWCISVGPLLLVQWREAEARTARLRHERVSIGVWLVVCISLACYNSGGRPLQELLCGYARLCQS